MTTEESIHLLDAAVSLIDRTVRVTPMPNDPWSTYLLLARSRAHSDLVATRALLPIGTVEPAAAAARNLVELAVTAAYINQDRETRLVLYFSWGKYQQGRDLKKYLRGGLNVSREGVVAIRQAMKEVSASFDSNPYQWSGLSVEGMAKEADAHFLGGTVYTFLSTLAHPGPLSLVRRLSVRKGQVFIEQGAMMDYLDRIASAAAFSAVYIAKLCDDAWSLGLGQEIDNLIQSSKQG